MNRTYREQNTGVWIINGMPVWEYEAKYPVYQRCECCCCMVHPEHIKVEETSGMNVCNDCMPEFLKEIEDANN